MKIKIAILTRIQGIAQCFLAQQLGTALLEKYYTIARILKLQLFYTTMIICTCFLFHLSPHED